MSLNITNQRVQALAREAARLTGQSQTRRSLVRSID
jgi:hypothetical protein